MLLLTAFTVIGMLTIDKSTAYPLSVTDEATPEREIPAWHRLFRAGLIAAMVVGLWQTALIGVLAGGVGTVIGVVLGFISAYFGGLADSGIKGICQILTPIPPFLIQVIIAGSLDKRSVTIYTMAFIVVLLSWMGPTLVIRSQVLSMKERQFVSVAKLSGMGDLGIIFGEILPNLLPFIAAAFVGQVFMAVFASFYLAVLGLGPCANRCWATSSGRRNPRAPSSMAGGGGRSSQPWRWCSSSAHSPSSTWASTSCQPAYPADGVK